MHLKKCYSSPAIILLACVGIVRGLDYKIRMVTTANKLAIVIDSGSGFIKAGFAGEEFPREVFPSVIGRATCSNIINGMNQVKSYIGYDALYSSNKLTLTNPIEHGIVTNWDDMETIWYHTFHHQLRVAPEDQPVLFTEPSWNPQTNRDCMTQIMFETFQVPAISIQTESILSLFASGRATGCVLDCGDTLSHIVPICEGNVIPHAIRRMDFGGHDLTTYLMQLLTERKDQCITMGTADREIVRHIKESLSYVAHDFESELKNTSSDHSSVEQHYELPDGNIITLGSERFGCPEALFQPQFLGKESVVGIHHHVHTAIQQCEVELQSTLSANIVLSGGSTMFRGMSERIAKEVTALFPSCNLKCKVIAPAERKYAVWIGASILASLSSSQGAPMWMTKAQYEEEGIDRERRRRPLCRPQQSQLVVTKEMSKPLLANSTITVSPAIPNNATIITPPPSWLTAISLYPVIHDEDNNFMYLHNGEYWLDIFHALYVTDSYRALKEGIVDTLHVPISKQLIRFAVIEATEGMGKSCFLAYVIATIMETARTYRTTTQCTFTTTDRIFHSPRIIYHPTEDKTYGIRQFWLLEVDKYPVLCPIAAIQNCDYLLLDDCGPPSYGFCDFKLILSVTSDHKILKQFYNVTSDLGETRAENIVTSLLPLSIQESRLMLVLHTKLITEEELLFRYAIVGGHPRHLRFSSKNIVQLHSLHLDTFVKRAIEEALQIVFGGQVAKDKKKWVEYVIKYNLGDCSIFLHGTKPSSEFLVIFFDIMSRAKVEPAIRSLQSVFDRNTYGFCNIEYSAHKAILTSKKDWFAVPVRSQQFNCQNVISLPFANAEWMHLHCLEDIVNLRHNSYGFPTMLDFPVVDAIFYHNGIIYLLLMTLSKFDQTSYRMDELIQIIESKLNLPKGNIIVVWFVSSEKFRDCHIPRVSSTGILQYKTLTSYESSNILIHKANTLEKRQSKRKLHEC